LYEGHEKIEHHRNMAKQLDITIGAFRNRVHQIRMNLKNSMRQCSLSKKSGSWPKSQVLH
jgi:hypothetical protein